MITGTAPAVFRERDLLISLIFCYWSPKDITSKIWKTNEGQTLTNSRRFFYWGSKDSANNNEKSNITLYHYLMSLLCEQVSVSLSCHVVAVNECLFISNILGKYIYPKGIIITLLGNGVDNSTWNFTIYWHFSEN